MVQIIISAPGELPPQEINRTSSSTFLAGASARIGNTELGSRMDESFSPVIFVYGLAVIVGIGKACTP